MNSYLTKSEIAVLDYLRWTSTLMIVACHFCQHLGSEWAWVLNVGVQIFFFLSGFLYGVKGIENARKFYKGRVIKLLIPYWIWITITLFLLCIFAPQQIELKAVIAQYTLLNCIRPGLPGLGHLWFMPVIFVCYLFLPLVDKIFNKNKYISIGVLLGAFAALFISRAILPFCLMWIPIYYIGYLCGRYRSLQSPMLMISIIGFILTCVFLHVQMEMVFTSVENYLTHSFGGIAIPLIALYLSRYIADIQRFTTGRGGYEVYLIHDVFIAGPLSLLFICKYTWLNILIILALIAICTALLMKASTKVSKILKL